MNILITGANGQLGSEFNAIQSEYYYNFIFSSSSDCDITDINSIESKVIDYSIDVIINCAAYTAVDNAEKESERAFNVNDNGVNNLVKCCEKHQITLIHISTDYVFDGESNIPYGVNDKINPTGVYGASKSKGEKHIIFSNSNSVIIRTSWVFSSFGNNFVKTMIRLGNERRELNVVSDQTGCPTYARDLARACLVMLNSKVRIDSKGKIYHYSNSGITNWATFAREIMSYGQIDCKIHDISTSEYPTIAKRPKYSVLDCSKIQQDFGIEIRSWHDALHECIDLINS